MDEQKDLEKLMDKIFDGDLLDAPSTNFTTSVLEKIEAEKKEQLAYTPLLPKWVFVVIGVFVALFVIFVFRITDPVSIGPQINYLESFKSISSWFATSASVFDFSGTLGYSIVAIGLVICLQASLLNKFVNRTNSLA